MTTRLSVVALLLSVVLVAQIVALFELPEDASLALPTFTIGCLFYSLLTLLVGRR